MEKVIKLLQVEMLQSNHHIILSGKVIAKNLRWSNNSFSESVILQLRIFDTLIYLPLMESILK